MSQSEAPAVVPLSPGDAPSAADLRAEALLYVRWVRGALGRSMAGEDPAAGGPTPSPLPLRRAGDVSVASASASPAVPVPATMPHVALPVGAPPSGEVPTHERVGGAGPRESVGSPGSVGGPGSGGGPGSTGGPGSGGGLGSVRDLDGVARDAATCTRCRLAATRRCVVFGEGPARPRLLVVGEAPGADEDASGRPFVGAAGQLLERMLAAVGLARTDVYIANVVKCRPPGNRPPSPDELGACRPYLDAQFEALRPDLVLLLGTVATRAVLGTERGITALRGQLLTTPTGLKALPTYHPAYLLRNPSAKREAWADLQRLASELGLTLPPRDASA